jgi:hypothetical protein
MNTRSQTTYEKKALYEVNIDFDEASEAWRANKKYIGNGSYKYITPKLNTLVKNTTNNNTSRRCFQQTQSGSQCKRESLNDCDYCFQHNK